MRKQHSFFLSSFFQMYQMKVINCVGSVCGLSERALLPASLLDTRMAFFPSLCILLYPNCLSLIYKLRLRHTLMTPFYLISVKSLISKYGHILGQGWVRFQHMIWEVGEGPLTQSLESPSPLHLRAGFWLTCFVPP